MPEIPPMLTIDPPLPSAGERVAAEGKAMGTKLVFAAFTTDKVGELSKKFVHESSWRKKRAAQPTWLGRCCDEWLGFSLSTKHGACRGLNEVYVIL